MSRMLRPSLHLRRCIAWLLIVASLFGLLAPSVSRVLGSSGAWVEVCTDAGMQWLYVKEDGSVGEGEEIARPHCPWCLVEAHHYQALRHAPPTLAFVPAHVITVALPAHPPALRPLPRSLHPPRAPPA